MRVLSNRHPLSRPRIFAKPLRKSLNSGDIRSAPDYKSSTTSSSVYHTCLKGHVKPDTMHSKGVSVLKLLAVCSNTVRSENLYSEQDPIRHDLAHGSQSHRPLSPTRALIDSTPFSRLYAAGNTLRCRSSFRPFRRALSNVKFQVHKHTVASTVAFLQIYALGSRMPSKATKSSSPLCTPTRYNLPVAPAWAKECFESAI